MGMGMIRQNTIMTIAASTAFGLVAVFLARGVVKKSVEAEYETVQSMSNIVVPINKTILSPIVVASKDLQFGDRLRASNLTIVEYPEKSIPNGAYTSIDSLLKDAENMGRSANRVMLDQIKTLEPILPHKISDPDGRMALSHRISPGMRASTLPITSVTGVAGFILPGDRVDILFLASSLHRLDDKKNEKVTKIAYQNVKVLAVDQESNMQSTEVRDRKLITFELTNEQAQKLHILRREGELLMTLRSAGDSAQDPTKYEPRIKDLIAANYFINRKRRPAPRPKSAAPPPAPKDMSDVTIFRGDERDDLIVKRYSDIEEDTAQLANH